MFNSMQRQNQNHNNMMNRQASAMQQNAPVASKTSAPAENSGANINPQELDGLLQTVSGKLGIDPGTLRQQLENGKFDGALKNMSPANAAKFQQVVNNPKLMEKFMSAPQMQSLYKKLTGGSGKS